ncbi:hypothetical protein KKA13_03055 [Patescibacteria group bacterium]|nr:hypothetical protein [Patescibacteria group bacterium]MBU1613294.1 hypothetical protein [Patescibacteria group bacterium]
MFKKYSTFIIAFLVLIFGTIAIFGGYIWFSKKQERVRLGLARSVWPYSDYTVDELDKLYPQYANADVPTTQTPEETHAKFIAALKKGDLDEAVECCFKEGVREKVKEGLEKVEAQGELEEMVNDLDTTISKDFVGDTKATYEYIVKAGDKEYGSLIEFEKNNQGIWLIDAL